jgi:hypothetical protein
VSLLLQVYSSTVMPTVRSRCMATVVKLLAIGSPSQLQAVLAELPISSFVAGLLCGRDIKAQAAAMQMAEILMAKLPQIFAGFFVKEGVAHALEQLAAASPAGARAAAAAGEGGGSGRRSSGAGHSADLPPPAPPITRSRRSSKADQVGGIVIVGCCTSLCAHCCDGVLLVQRMLRCCAALLCCACCMAPVATVQMRACLPSTVAATCIAVRVWFSMCLQARDDAKESAAADRAGPSAAVESLRMPSVTLRDAVARRAAAFKQQHFKADGPGAAAGLESEGLQELRQLCDQLASDDSCVPALLEVGVGGAARA